MYTVGQHHDSWIHDVCLFSELTIMSNFLFTIFSFLKYFYCFAQFYCYSIYCLCSIFMYVCSIISFFSNSSLWCWSLFTFLSKAKFGHPAIDRHLGFSSLHLQTVLIGTFLNSRASLEYIPRIVIVGSKGLHTLHFKFHMILLISTETSVLRTSYVPPVSYPHQYPIWEI